MTTIEVRNFRRCERADLSGGPLLLVAGNNANGKSSVLSAIAAAGARSGSPEDRTKAEAKTLVLHGQETATAYIETEDGSVRLSLPAFKVTEDGTPPILSRMAAGLEPLTDITPAKRAALLSQWIKAEPTLEDVRLAVKDAELPDTLPDGIMKEVAESGWHGAFKRAQELGTKLKGKWEGLTGAKRWGANIAAEWVPDGWRDDLAAMTLAEANQAVEDAREALEAAIATSAISADEMKKLEESAGLLTKAEEQLVSRNRDFMASQAELKELVAKREALPIAQGSTVDVPCPCCGVLLRIKDRDGIRELVEAPKDTMTDKERAAMRVEIADLDGSIARVGALVRQQAQLVDSAELAIESAKKSAAKLEAAKGKKGSTDALSDARAAMEKANDDFALVETKVNAGKTHKAIIVNGKIQLILSDGGLRKTVLNRQMKAFNDEHVAPVYQAAGWPVVTLDANMEPVFDGYEYRDLSKSHQWIARTVLQIAIARLDGSSLVLLDEADLLDAKNRNRLFGMLVKLKLPAVVGMTVNVPNLAPDLAAKKVGASYWIANGITQPLADAIKA